MIELRTERLLIRNFRADDASALHAYLSLPEVLRYEPGGTSDEEACRRLASERAGADDFLAVCLEPDERLIGHIYFALRQPPELATWMLGFIFNPVFGGQGYATEACRAVVRAGFLARGVHRATALCNPKNERSWRLLERIGMQREGCFRRDVFFRTDPDGNPVWQDTYQYAMLAEDA